MHGSVGVSFTVVASNILVVVIASNYTTITLNSTKVQMK
jgi:hypothetical protein